MKLVILKNYVKPLDIYSEVAFNVDNISAIMKDTDIETLCHIFLDCGKIDISTKDTSAYDYVISEINKQL